MADIGTAVIRVVADSRGFQRSVESFAKSADGIGRQFGERLGESTSRWLRRGLVAGAAGLAFAVGGALKKGFDRFTTIEDATASLTLQLGDATEAAQLLDDTLAVVEGTPFALDQFVDAARNLIAASIPLDKVPGILQAVADGAAAAGGSAQDVDNVVNAIGRLATGAELTLGPIRDLEEQGVPALRILANRAGKSTRQMAKDITAGTVDSKTAIDDLVAGIIEGTDGINGATVAFGGAAKNVGNTVRGAYDNMRIAIARAGAKVIGVFADSGTAGNGLVAILNSLRQTIDILGERAVVMAERFVGSDGFGRVLAFFEELPERVRTEGLAAVLLDGLEQGLRALPTERLSEVLTFVIVRSIEGLVEGLPVIIAAVIRLAPSIIGAIAKGLFQAAKENPLDLGVFLVALGVPGVAAALAGFFSALPFGSIVAPLISGIGKAIAAGFSALGLGSAFTILGDKIALGIVALAGPIATALTATLITIAGIALGVLLHNLIERFLPQVNRALEDGGAALYDFFVDLPDRIIGALGNLGGRLYDIGRNAIDSLKRGAESVLVDSAWGRFWQDVGGDIYDRVTGELEIRSPSKKFMFIGRQVVEGLKIGVERGLPSLDATLSKLVPTDRMAFAVSADGSAGLSGSQVVHHWTINEATPQTTAEQVIARLATA